MKLPKALHYKLLRNKVTKAEVKCKDTSQIKTLTKFIGHQRALEALNFGVNIKSVGYNLYCMGPAGIGKRTLLQMVLDEHAQRKGPPSDWCYIYNFETPKKPIALELPAGIGTQLQQDMDNFIDELDVSVRSLFESGEYRHAMKRIKEYYSRNRRIIVNIYAERHTKENELKTKMVHAVIKPMITRLKSKYRAQSAIIQYLDNVQYYIEMHGHDFLKVDEKTNLLTLSIENIVLTKFKVNLLVDNSENRHPPIILENAPTYSNLICRIEHTSEHGTLVTNFTLIRAGALHKANGGYLILEARKIIKDKEAWEALKSALYQSKVRIQPLRQMSNAVTPVSLEPEPIPLDIKIILLGDRNTYYSLCQDDPDFLSSLKWP